MTDKTADELLLREVAMFVSDMGMASMESKLLALIKRLDAPGPRLTEQDRFVRNPQHGKCKCGLHEIERGVDGVNWYWQYHTRLKCTLELPNEKCWCGLLRSEHLSGHNEVDRLSAQPKETGKVEEAPAVPEMPWLGRDEE